MFLFHCVIIVILALDYSLVPSSSEEALCVPCVMDDCQLPECRCLSREGPGNLFTEETPQMVAFTFEGSVNNSLFNTISQVFSDKRKNPNNSSLSMTIFVSGQSTEYYSVQKLWEKGHEIASGGNRSDLPKSWWANATQEQWEEQMVGLKEELVRQTKIPGKYVTGMRAPYLQGGSDTMFKMMAEDSDFLYDSTLVEGGYQTKRYWPYTLDYDHTQFNCTNPTCPTGCYKGLWELPVSPIVHHSAPKVCNASEECIDQPANGTIYLMLKSLFNAAYQSNKAPVVYSIDTEWFLENDQVKTELENFLDEILNNSDVFVISVSQILDWMKDPTPLKDIDDFQPWNQTQRQLNIKLEIMKDQNGTSFFLTGTGIVVCECTLLTLFALCVIFNENKEDMMYYQHVGSYLKTY